MVRGIQVSFVILLAEDIDLPLVLKGRLKRKNLISLLDRADELSYYSHTYCITEISYQQQQHQQQQYRAIRHTKNLYFCLTF